MHSQREPLTWNMLVLYVSGLIYGVAGNLWTPFWVLYIRSLGATLPQTGIVLSLGSVTGTFMILSGGFLSDRFGRKKLVVMPGQLLLGAILLSFNCMRFAALQAVTAESSNVRRHAQAYAGSEIVLALPGTIAPILAGSIVGSEGAQAGQKRIFIITILLVSLANTLRAILLRETLESANKQEKEDRYRRSDLIETVEAVFTNRSIRGVLMSMAIGGFASELVSSLLVLYCVSEVGLSETEFGVMMSVSVFTMITSRLPVARLSDRFGRRLSMLIGGFMYPAWILALLIAPSFHWFLLAATIGSIANSFTIPARRAYIAESVPMERRARTFGVIASSMMLSTVPAPIVATLLWYKYGPAAPFTLCIGLFTMAGIILAKYLEE